jgi:hypothetical protein
LRASEREREISQQGIYRKRPTERQSIELRNGLTARSISWTDSSLQSVSE